MLNFSIDIQNEREFNKTFTEYMRWQKAQPSQIINSKLYFIALQAMRLTKAADKTNIAAKLMSPSNTNPEVPLVAILINHQLHAKNKKGLTGAAMVQAMEKYVRKAQSKTQFLRSGWIPALKTLDFYNKKDSENLKFTKRYAPKRPEGVKQYGKDKGMAKYARLDQNRVYGSISNFVGKGKQASPTVVPILMAGLNAAVKAECH